MLKAANTIFQLRLQKLMCHKQRHLAEWTPPPLFTLWHFVEDFLWTLRAGCLILDSVRSVMSYGPVLPASEFGFYQTYVPSQTDQMT